ncbi:FolB domain-containing protein [Helicobacter cetorum]|uniref:FolB domain-containing protein n=1 Tax=Helicobacter cetorum TaxID=138563 RepID=UPI000CF0BBC1|nr:dihydroneopterin aldolase [Helicobacter cetorum]
MTIIKSVHVHDFIFETILGILEHERHAPQKVRLNLDATYKEPCSKNYLDYMQVQKLLQDTMNERRYLLIEDALNELPSILKTFYPNLSKITLQIMKLEVCNHSQVGGSIEICY